MTKSHDLPRPDLPRPDLPGPEYRFADNIAFDDQWAADFAPIITVNPATNQILAELQAAGPQEINQKLARAKDAQRQWAALTPAERGRKLRRVADLLRAENDALARLESQDTGKPIQETLVVDVASGAECFEYFAAVAATDTGDYVDLGQNAFGYTRREPIGVVAAIGAWNYPLQIACWKSAPALAAGNAVIFKPAELTPLSAIELERIIQRAGLPDGIFTVVQGRAATGQLLIAHQDIGKVSLTGEVGTGKRVMRAAAAGLKRVTLELGGKSPMIIFADADLDDAVSGAMIGNFYSAGEVCSNGTRVYVHDDIRAEFIDRLLTRINRMVIGDPLDPRTQIGAVISPQHHQKIMNYIEAGQRQGAILLCGGGVSLAGELKGGNFVRPCVFDGGHDDMAIAREEIFGPVMTILPFTDESDVIARANNTEFGLAAGVFTRDLARGHRVIAQLRAGTCWINHYNVTPVELPFGGMKLSGIGRENSRLALDHFSEIKSVYVNLSKVDAPY
ncbi:MAG: betaine-aldehyde dehydrogenase [Candidatus Symbiobacter sp.]|nr:betaine-aldehyde dehydrogenase [Candidatus Symbiobacter sp.]